MKFIEDTVVSLVLVLFPTLVVFTAFVLWRFRTLKEKLALYRRLAKKRQGRIGELETKLQAQQAAYRALSAKFDRFVAESEAAETRLRHELVEARGSI